MEHNSVLAQQIKEARLTAGLSQQALADAVGVNLRTAGHWERTGEVPALRMAKLRSVLPALGQPSREDWRLVPEPANARNHLVSYETSAPLALTPLARLQQLRRELARITLEMDECLAELERGQP